MEYINNKDSVTCMCKSGYEFLIDPEDLLKVKDYNWFMHNGRMEGNKGGRGERVMLSRIVMNISDKHIFVRQKVRNNDFRKSNLYLDNDYIDCGEYYEVLSGSKSFLIDKEDKPKIDSYHWRINNQGYAEAIMNGKRVLLHRFIMGLDDFASYDEVIDHINRIRSDNRKNNLRVVTQKENTRNGSGAAGKTSGIPGVYYDKHIKRWRGSYRDGDNQYNIGLHNSKESAVAELERCKKCIADGEEYIKPSNMKKPSSGERYIYKTSSGYAVTIKNKYIGFGKTVDECIKMRDAYLQI